ncbi:MAG: hypothetical protein Q8934_10210 [Bacillota bacterium]|nr:hypothetical protein [Bacillota bacterium]
MKPTPEEVGIVSIEEAIVMKDFSEEEWNYIGDVFQEITGNNKKKTLDIGDTKLHFIQDPYHDLTVELKAKTINQLYEKIELEKENIRLVIG